MNRPILLISIDPSMRNLGYAVHEITDWNKGKLIEVGAITNTEKAVQEHWHAPAVHMAEMLRCVISGILGSGTSIAYGVVVTELQEVFQAAKGQAAMDSGSIQKLYFFTGLATAMLSQIENVMSIWGVTPTKWKQQTKKEVMQYRAEQYMKNQDYEVHQGMPHDSAEAVLLGKYAISKMAWRCYRELHTLDFNEHIGLLSKSQDLMRREGTPTVEAVPVINPEYHNITVTLF